MRIYLSYFFRFIIGCRLSVTILQAPLYSLALALCASCSSCLSPCPTPRSRPRSSAHRHFSGSSSPIAHAGRLTARCVPSPTHDPLTACAQASTSKNAHATDTVCVCASQSTSVLVELRNCPLALDPFGECPLENLDMARCDDDGLLPHDTSNGACLPHIYFPSIDQTQKGYKYETYEAVKLNMQLDEEYELRHTETGAKAQPSMQTFLKNGYPYCPPDKPKHAAMVFKIETALIIPAHSNGFAQFVKDDACVRPLDKTDAVCFNDALGPVSICIFRLNHGMLETLHGPAVPMRPTGQVVIQFHKELVEMLYFKYASSQMTVVVHVEDNEDETTKANRFEGFYRGMRQTCHKSFQTHFNTRTPTPHGTDCITMMNGYEVIERGKLVEMPVIDEKAGFDMRLRVPVDTAPGFDKHATLPNMYFESTLPPGHSSIFTLGQVKVQAKNGFNKELFDKYNLKCGLMTTASFNHHQAKNETVKEPEKWRNIASYRCNKRKRFDCNASETESDEDDAY